MRTLCLSILNSGIDGHLNRISTHMQKTIKFITLILCLHSATQLASAEDSRPNVVLVLCDDHRWDAMSMMGHPFLKTPHMDRLAREGVHFENAFVTTSLCSPSRASILTGLFAHNHGVVDNYHPVDPSLTFFPQYLQKSGYETAFVGKWHMGDEDDPQRGFDHWVAFRGQGTYYPDGRGTTRVVPQTRYDGMNVNGKRVPQKGYITDELTDYAIDWVKNGRNDDKPFFLYVSHKAVHSDFVPRDKDRNKYQDAPWTPPVTFPDTPENRKGKPRWLIDQRNSRHGADYGYNLPVFDMEVYYKRYCESLIAVDDNLGRLMNCLDDEKLAENTLVIYVGDNGFQFGEHGLIDKRTAYEASMRVPLLMRYPKKFKPGSTVEQVVANIDLAPTIMDAAGLEPAKNMDGMSAWKVAQGQEVPWRSSLLYEYYWEWNYPQTPTVLAVRGDRYKYIRYHGIWDTDELYDIKADPEETKNLIRDPSLTEVATELKQQLFEQLEASGGLKIPLLPDRGRQFYYRHPERAKQGEFPQWYYDIPEPVKK